ncbi:MAG TPA: adenine deaminase [Nitrospirota bacterium]|nr:adenine deaminase [Nitrospirota bacterium]
MKNDLKDRIVVARGLKKADLVLKGGRIVNVHSGEIYNADVAIYRGKIAGLGKYEGKKTIDVSNKFVLPGLIDSHLHLESSMLTPAEFTRAALPHGTTTVIVDPHEIANVLGTRGLNYMLAASEGLPLDFYFMLPSCVPATPLETSGARLAARDLLPFLDHERVLGLAEMMNYHGLLAGAPDVLAKLRCFSGTIIDGHAPKLSGKDLAAYIGTGITSDHECTTAQEAKEKVRLGMTVYIREGSAAKDLEALLPAVTHENSRFFCLATDDLQAEDLCRGSIDQVVRKAIRLGLSPVIAVQMATINPALHFCLKRKGAILPGYDADMIVIDDFDAFSINMVFKNGALVAENGKVLARIRVPRHAPPMKTVKIKPMTSEHIRLRAKTDKARVIELIPDQIETWRRVMPISSLNGYVVSDIEHDVLKLLVIERHRASGNVGFGLVKGFGLKSGALASTVAHDSHNIIVVGTNDDDMFAAVLAIKKLEGGMVAVDRGKVMASLPLPVAGLISNQHAGFVAAQMKDIRRAARQMGVAIDEPFSALSFLALPVVPELKLTDKGLVDVKQFNLVELFV